MELEELAVRVEKLETENGRLKLAGSAVVAVLLGVACVGAVIPQEQEIRATKLTIIDSDGNALLETENDPELGLILGIRDANGAHRVALHQDGLDLYPSGGATATYRSDGLSYNDPDGTVRLFLNRGGSLTDTGLILLRDRSGVTRFQAVEALGQVTLELYDTEGNVIWQAPS